MLYLAQVIIYTGAMFLVYLLFLRNKPMHRFNRWYLLATVLLPVLIPFIKMPELLYSRAPVVSVLQLELPEYVVSSSQQTSAGSFTGMLWTGYWAVALVMLSFIIYKWLKLRSVIKNGLKTKYTDYTLVQDTGYGPGSWMQYVLLPESAVDDTIIHHELVHVRQKHSYDVIMMSIVQIIFWPNLFLFWIRKELVQVHEFLADEAVNMDAQSYSKLLLSSVFNTCTLPMTHSFIIHPIKRRIMMLSKNSKKTPIIAGIAAIVVVLFLVFNLVGLQSCKPKNWEVDKTAGKTEKVHVQVSDDGIYNYADKMPEFKGNFSQYLAEHIKYPEDMQAQKIEGKVVVQFVIDETGAVKNPEIVTVNITGPEDNSTAVQTPGNSFSDAALALVAGMPDWIPGEDKGKAVPVRFRLPIQYKLK